MDPEWETHKEIIRDRYLKQDKMLKRVMTEMKEVHHFQATYETSYPSHRPYIDYDI